MPFQQHDEISHLSALFYPDVPLSRVPTLCSLPVPSLLSSHPVNQTSCRGVAVYLTVAPKHKSSDADSSDILLLCLVCKLTCTIGMYVQEKIQFFLQTKARQLNFVGFSFPSYKMRFCSRRVLRILKGLYSYGYIRFQKTGSRLLYLKMNLGNQQSNQIL